MTTSELIVYYANLLIFQYLGKPNAYATIQALVNGPIQPQTSTQEITFSGNPTSGTLVLTYNGNNTVPINWNDTTATIQSDLQALPGLSQVTVSGSISTLSLTVTFTGVTPPASLLSVYSSSLEISPTFINVEISETDLTLPLAIQNGFNLIGPNPAVGVQLDILGKYVGVVRTGSGLQGQPIILSDADFLILIQMAIIKNNAGSSYYDITNLIYGFFGGSILVLPSGLMHMTYLISYTASSNLIEIFITENLLPVPMGVAVSIIYVPVANNLFGFITYENPVQPTTTTPFNSYVNYNTDWSWLSYKDVIVI